MKLLKQNIYKIALEKIKFIKIKKNKTEKKNLEPYPNILIEGYKFFDRDIDPKGFFLCGETWLNGRVGPSEVLAIAWGINEWKWGVVCKYFPNKRIIYAKRKIGAVRFILYTIRLPLKINEIIVWGLTDTWFVKLYCKLCGVKLIRIEDGFLRSSELGASHSPPYSLSIDSQSIYFHRNQKSELIYLLNNYKLKSEELVSAKAELMRLVSSGLSKYNPPTVFNKKEYSLSLNSRIGVLGQVRTDQSLRHGNIDNWTDLEMVKLAAYENPQAVIVYRPHPQQETILFKSKKRVSQFEQICVLNNSNQSIQDFLNSVDHVYTINSTSGLEAILYGKKVTTLGLAFYGGWGLTDDRLNSAKYIRHRKLSILELFFIIYLKYPRYIANLDDTVSGFQATCFRIRAERRYNLNSIPRIKNLLLSEPSRVLDSKFWPAFYFSGFGKVDSQIAHNSDIYRMPISDFFTKGLSVHAEQIIAAIFLGFCSDDRQRAGVLVKIRDKLSVVAFGKILMHLDAYFPGAYLMDNYRILFARVGQSENLDEYYSSSLSRFLGKCAQKELSASVMPNDGSTLDNSRIQSILDNEIQQESERVTLNSALVYFKDLRLYDKAVECAVIQLLCGNIDEWVCQKTIQLLSLLFDSYAVRQLSDLYRIGLFHRTGTDWLLHYIRSLDLQHNNLHPDDLLDLLVCEAIVSPDKIDELLIIAKKFSAVHDVGYIAQLLRIIIKMDDVQSLKKARAYLALGESDKALSILRNISNDNNFDSGSIIALADIYVNQGLTHKAYLLLRDCASMHPSLPVFQALIKVCIYSGNFKSALEHLRMAEFLSIELGDMYYRKIHFGLGNIEQGFLSFKSLNQRQSLRSYYKDKYLSDITCLQSNNSILLLTIFGPGDEIRFASIVNNLSRHINCASIFISCSPKLYPLFLRSFPDVNLVPVNRIRNSDLYDDSDYDMVPGSDLIGILDNNAIRVINQVDKLSLITDFLPCFYRGYGDFSGDSFLIKDETRSAEFKKQLPSDLLIVGISWRSSVLSYARNEHYFSVEEISELFQISGVHFVNLQYDDSAEEVRWLQENFPGRLTNFQDLDQFNDLDGVAALMGCCDIVITAATTVFELAGSLGAETWLLVNSQEILWRQRPGTEIDVFHKSVRHVVNPCMPDKAALVSLASHMLTDYVCSKS